MIKMKNKGFILAIFLIFIVFLSLSNVYADDISNNNLTTSDNLEIQKSQDIASISQNNENNKLSSSYDITIGSDSATIQNTINAMEDGDTLNFEAGEYRDICIYVNKSITINGNGATLIGYNTPSQNNTPSIIYNKTSDNGYGISNFATLYILGNSKNTTNNVIITGLTIVGQNTAYGNAAVYSEYCNNLNFSNNVIKGSSWGLYYRFCHDGTIGNNLIQDQSTTGILNFGSARSIIVNNTIKNSKNHGIDVRHGTGPNVKVINNTIIASKEGIYLMHSKGHYVSGNKLINNTISSISCYGSSLITLVNNTLIKSRIGILLGGGYSNITVGKNDFSLDNLPYPPTFVYYVAEAKSDYQSATEIVGTYSDSSTYENTYTQTVNIATPKMISIDYTVILNQNGNIYNVTNGMTSAQIQGLIDSMHNGDTLSFERNAIFRNISIYTDKNIKIIGNNATLIGYDNVNMTNVPEKIRKTTEEGGYALSERAVLYILNNTNVVVSNLNIIAKYLGYNTSKVNVKTDEYKTAGIRTQKSTNITITNVDIKGASWGIYLEYSGNALISNNKIHDVYTTGILNFRTPNSLIANNTITNAINHGIDVRHGTGPNVTVFNNTIIGAKEGIYLMHSKGHSVYNNTIINSKISGITAYGSGNEVIFNNTITGVRIAILLGGNYYNVTIGKNNYSLDSLPFPPTFATYIAKAENKYQSEDNVIRTYSDKESVKIIANNITTTSKTGEFSVILTDMDGKAIKMQNITFTVNNKNYTTKTDENGTAKINYNVNDGINTVSIIYSGNDNYASATQNYTITVNRITSKITIPKSINVYLTKAVSGYNYKIILKDAFGKVLANKTLTVTYNSKTYNIKTNDKGVATIKAVKSLGSKKISIKFAGDTTYKSTIATGTIKVIKEKSVLKVPKKTFKAKAKSKKIKITLKSKSGKAIKNARITLKVKGKTYKAKTDSKGIATVKLKLTKKGIFKATTKFSGNKYYNGVSLKSKIIIKK